MKKNLSLALAILCLATQHAFAAPAKPGAINYKLPDGTEITIELRGDEWANWAVTPDGFTMLFNADGFPEYAVQDESGDLKLSGVRANNTSQRSTDEQRFLERHSKGLRFSPSQLSTMRQLRGMRDQAMRSPAVGKAPQRSSKVTGNIRIPVILVGFPNRAFTKAKADFELLFNQVNLTTTPDGPVTGSVRDYFLDASRGQMNLQVDVFGPYTMPNNIGSYDHQNGGQPWVMAQLAVQAAYADGCNFANYDADGDGEVDAVHILFAGYDQAGGAPKGQSIWSHAGTVSGTPTLNGVQVVRYSCSPELRGIEGTDIMHIGTAVHELGHSLGELPDLYDADGTGSGGEAIGLGAWDLMASGNWNDEGRTPPLFSAWSREFLGWVTS